jgi:hypothetical protein
MDSPEAESSNVAISETIQDNGNFETGIKKKLFRFLHDGLFAQLMMHR